MEQSKRVEQIYHHFEQGDNDLGYRKLLDLVSDSNHMPFFKEMIKITEMMHENTKNEEEIRTRLEKVLQEITKWKIPYYTPSKPVLQADQITKVYTKNNFKLGPVTLDLYPRDVVGLVGENGNGKTTLLTILAQELSKSSGSLAYHFSTAYKNSFDLRTRLAYVPQRTKRWYGSLQDNLKFVLASYGTPEEEIEARMFLMIARLGLWKYRNLNWDELSSGYKMRFELARTLLRKPEILLLDEPLANLDVLAQQVILEDLKHICNSLSHPIALILSSQQLYEVEKVSHHVIFLNQGQTLTDSEKMSHEVNVIIELDTEVEKAVLQKTFETLNIEEIKYNGGIYVLYFPRETNQADVLAKIAENQIDIINFRDITNSSRRYFI